MKFARRQNRGRFLALLGAAGLCWLSVSCTTAPKPVARQVSSAAARVTLINESDYAWRIVAKPANGGAPIEGYVTARASIEMTLPSQEYAVEQTMLLRADIASSSRRFPFTPEAGQVYRWRLGTLLSNPLRKETGTDKTTTPLEPERGTEGGGDRE